MFKCTVCEVEKPISEFYKRNDLARGYYSRCKICEENIRKQRKIERHEEVYFYLAENGCEVCGENNPLKLEFDHVDPKTKKYNVSDMLSRSTYGINSIWKEIAKCRILCSNCHKVKTHKERNSIPYQIHQSCK